MKNWMILGAIMAILVEVIVFEGVFCFQNNTKLQQAESEISRISADIATVNSGITNLESQVATLSQSLSDLHSSVSNYEDTITSLGNSIATINNSILSLESSLNSIQDTISVLPSQGGTTQDLMAKIEPSVVRIDVTGPYFEGSASGIIIGNYCCVLTCYHVVDGATTINVALDSGETFPATVLLWSKGRDIAVLQMKTGRFDFPFDFPAAVFGSSSAMAVGDDVVSIGYALDLPGAPSVTMGTISAFRTLDDGYEYIQIQTDAAINAGDSGGPLVNMKGEVIGIAAAVETYDKEGNPIATMKYCIPIDEAKSLIQTAIGIFDETIAM